MGSTASNNDGKNWYQGVFSPLTYVLGDDAGAWADPLGNIIGHSFQNVNNWIGGYHDPEGATWIGGSSDANDWMNQNVGGIFDDKLGKNTDKWKEYYDNLQKKKDDITQYAKDHPKDGAGTPDIPDRTSGGGLTKPPSGGTDNASDPFLGSILDGS